jgi:hypothetical protein
MALGTAFKINLKKQKYKDDLAEMSASQRVLTQGLVHTPLEQQNLPPLL